MPRIELTLLVDAPIDRCFDLARSIDLHVRSTAGTSERAIAGVTSGLIGPGEEVTWEARHFGIRQRLTSRIRAYDRPYYFRDSQVRGAFRRFDHDHRFEPVGAQTRMVEVFDYAAPLGLLGRLAERLALTAYMRRFLLAHGGDQGRRRIAGVAPVPEHDAVAAASWLRFAARPET